MDFKVIRNDISAVQVDAVVLPANWMLRMGTGVSMALFEAAGREEVEAECSALLEQAKSEGRRLVPGVTVPTHAFDLPAKVILHTIVPRWDEGNPSKSYEDLCKAYASALFLADEMDMESIAFPLLASGNNGFDPDTAIEIAVQSLEQYQPKNKLSLAYLVTFDSSVTKKMKALGYEVEETIDQMHVLDQKIHQAKARQNALRRGVEKLLPHKKPLPKKVLDGAVEWLRVPENQQAILGFAFVIARIAIPKEGKDGKGGKVLEVLDAVEPLVKGKAK